MKDILIVVDAQNDFITGSLGSAEAKKVVPNIVKKIDDHNGLIFVTQDTHQQDYLDTQEGLNLPIIHCQQHQYGWDINDDIARALLLKSKLTVFNVEKCTFGSFDLINAIKRFSNDNEFSIEIIGYVLDICVITNALLLKTAFPEARITVDTSCCAATSKEAFDAAVTVLKSCQMEVR